LTQHLYAWVGNLQRIIGIAAVAGIGVAGCGGGGTGGTSAALLPTSSGGAGSSVSSTPVPQVSNAPGTPTPAPNSASASPTPTGTVIWKAGDPNLGRWVVANTYQCGSALQSGTQFSFLLSRNGTSCGRNQANPTIDVYGDLVRLQQGRQYTWTFHYIDGTPIGGVPRMGPDNSASSLIWQIHDFNASGSGASLGFTNNAAGAQVWYLSSGSGYQWEGAYTPGEQDDWKIVALVSNGSSGRLALFRNGAEVASITGANFSSSSDPWWNFGPYKWRWELAGGGGSTMIHVGCTIQQMLLTEQ
jgi:hypothetical protein